MIDNTFLFVTTHVTAPVLVSYMIWVLSDAKKRGIKTLLFVARDGLAMCRIAEILNNVWGMGIECRYMYASRYSLRLPMFAVDREYALEKLCEPESGNTSISAVLAAAGLKNEQVKLVINELNVIPDKRLSPFNLKEIKQY